MSTLATQDQFDTRGHNFGFRDGRDILVMEADQFSPEIRVIGGSIDCFYCSEFQSWKKEGDKFVAQTECEYANFTTYSVKLNVPSGRIVVADDLRGVFGDAEEVRPELEQEDYNATKGRVLHARVYEELGVAYGCVLNTCPDVFLVSDGDEQKLVIASTEWDEEADEPIIPAGWTKIAGICTDLWAYSIADYDDYVAKRAVAEEAGFPSGRDADVEVAEIPAGVWEFTHFAEQAGFDYHAAGVVIFAEAKRISK